MFILGCLFFVVILISIVIGLVMCADLQLSKDMMGLGPSAPSKQNLKTTSDGKITPELLAKKMAEQKKQVGPVPKDSKVSLKGVLVTQPKQATSVKNVTKAKVGKVSKGVSPGPASKIKSHLSSNANDLSIDTLKSNTSIKEYETEKFEAGYSTIPDLMPKSQQAMAKGKSK